jgi:hypothetical protein
LVDSTGLACAVVSFPPFTLGGESLVSAVWHVHWLWLGLDPLPEFISSFLLILLTKWHCHLFMDNTRFFFLLFMQVSKLAQDLEKSK